MPWELLVWAVPVGVVVTGIYRPLWGLLFFAASLPFFGSPPGGPYLAAFDVAALAVIATSLRAPSPPRSPLTLPVLMLAVVGLASLLPPLYSPPSWSPRGLVRLITTLHGVESWTVLYTWRAALDLTLGIGIFHAVRRIHWKRDPAPLGAAMAVGLGVTSVLGLLEHVEILDLSTYRAVGQYVAPERMHSVFFNSGWLAEYLVVGAPFTVAALLVLRRRRMATVLGAVSLSCILLTQQRGAWVAGLAQLGLLVGVTGRRLLEDGALRRRLAVSASLTVALLATVVVLSPGPRSDALRSRLARPFSDLAGREALWQASLHMAPQRPLLGWGLGSFAPVYDSFHPPGSTEARRPRGTAHNWYLNLLVETGGVGLAAFALLVGTVWVCLRGVRQEPDSSQGRLAAGLAVSFAGALIYGLVQYMPFLRSVHWLLWILLGTAACRPLPRTPRWIPWAALAILGVTLVSLPFRWPSRETLLRGDRTYGFSEPALSGDRHFQWAGPRAAGRIAWTGDCLRVPLANGHPSPQHQVEVTIRAAGASAHVQPSRDWSNHVLEVGSPSSSSLVVELTARPSFRPFQDLPHYDLLPSRDVRLLGVAVGKIETALCAGADGVRTGEDGSGASGQ